MKSRQLQPQKGFTIIEMIIVLVIIGILAALIIFSYNGVRSRDRDALRQENIETIQSYLEIHYAEKSSYPTLSQINNSKWRTDNLPELQAGSLQDPGWQKDGECASDSQAMLIGTPTDNCYAYSPTAANGESCNNKNRPCAHYTLTARLESGEEYIKTSLN